ncbi:energy transducer TonB [Tenacibaculum sp. nBUS_03]|uniref:energy transducer TonB n=1 Tax=Tenacibaculum sp. nBUS_03 TaxID=3395320 RepID=UPI003EB8A803
MKMPKKMPRKQLEKFSTIFMQLGLVLTLSIVYFVLEYETKQNENFPITLGEEISKDYSIDELPQVFIKKVKKTVAKTSPQKKITLDITKIEKIDNDEVIKNIVDLPATDSDSKIDISNLPEADEGEIINTNDDPITMRNLQNAPVYRGCEGLNEQEGRKCLERKIRQHVQRYFNSEIAQDLGMRSGKYRISTQFVIDKQGNIIDLNIRAPHTKLKKEVVQLVKKIPQFTPGKQNNVPVKVKYTLPITFMVE